MNVRGETRETQVTSKARLASAASWGAIAIALLIAAVPAAAQGVTVAVTPTALEVSPGAVFYLDITVTQAGSPFNGFDAVIGYDPNALTLIPLSPISLQEGSLMTSACGNTFHIFRQGAATDTITDVLLCAGVSLTGPGQIYRLKFQASMAPQVTAVRFLSGPNFFNGGFRITPVQATDASIGIGTSPVAVEPDAPPGRIELRVAPNPSRGSATFTIESDADGPERVTVVDVAGRIVRRFDRSATGAHLREISWDGRDAGGRAVPAGIYFVTLETVNRKVSRTLSIVR
jgi:hypothetical protein